MEKARLSSVLSTVAALGLLLAWGCSRSSDDREELTGKSSPVKTAAAEAKPVTVPAEPPAVTPQQKSVGEVAAVSRPATPKQPVPPRPAVRITALMKRGSAAPKVGIVQDSTGIWRILREGDDFLGYRVKKIRYDDGVVELDWYGESVTLSLKGKKVKKAIITPDKPGNGEPQLTEAKMVIGGTEIKPTADEIARGIDPNDPATWPQGYRGPVIERIAAQMPPSADSGNMPAVEPPQGTPEEIKQRFLETYAPKAPQSSPGQKSIRFPQK